jgi:glycosyltransferase involved in cell wall biosynthesis
VAPDNQTGRRIAVASIGDAASVRFWSGTPFNMSRALASQGHEIVYICPLRAPVLPVYKAFARLRRVLHMPGLSPFHARAVFRQYGADALRRIRSVSPDIVFAPAGSPFAWNVPEDIPLVYASDATFRVIEDYFPNYTNLSRTARALADRLEHDTIARASLLLYPSEWAAESAIRDYGADPARVKVISWGANIDVAPDRESVLRPRRPGPCRLLFVGVDWERKGARVAVEILAGLRNKGVDAELVICGCRPPADIGPEGLTVIPFLDKNDPAQRDRMDQLYREADFFVLPTRADCYGIVFCEAASYALPSIAPATGGVGGAVHDGVNGILMRPDAASEDYVAVIAGIFRDPDRLMRLRRSSRDAFEDRLNWDAWGRRVSELLSTL